MSLIQSDAVRVFDRWALGIHHGPAGSVLVTGMSGEVVHLDSALVEQRRWQAHAGAVNALRVVDGQIWTGGGDGLVKVWDWTLLAPVETFAGPKKPVTSLFFAPSRLIAQTYERAVYVWNRAEPGAQPRKFPKIASLAQNDAGWLGCPKTGSKAGEIGALAELDLETGQFGNAVSSDGFAAWSLQSIEGRGLLAFGLDLRACFVDPATGRREPVAWHSKSGPPGYLRLSDGGEVLFGDGQIDHRGQVQKAPIKGLYCAIQLPDARLAFSGADGQIWVFTVED
ncbi:MAG: hypothetical protein CME01_05775 [Geminicoccus sp.]|nr:hypothetical protein [Geminicoccus sp.]